MAPHQQQPTKNAGGPTTHNTATPPKQEPPGDASGPTTLHQHPRAKAALKSWDNMKPANPSFPPHCVPQTRALLLGFSGLLKRSLRNQGQNDAFWALLSCHYPNVLLLDMNYVAQEWKRKVGVGFPNSWWLLLNLSRQNAATNHLKKPYITTSTKNVQQHTFSSDET